MKKIAEITKTYNEKKSFKNGMANNLDAGTPIYQLKEDISLDDLYIKVGEQSLKFSAEVEG